MAGLLRLITSICLLPRLLSGAWQENRMNGDACESPKFKKTLFLLNYPATEAAKISSIVSDSIALKSASGCCADNPSVSARLKLAMTPVF